MSTKQQSTTTVQPKILRLPDVLRYVGLCRSHVYKGIKAGTFPASVRLTGRAVGWRVADLDAWLASREATK